MNMDIVTNEHDEKYHGALRKILDTGEHRSDRTGTGTISRFGLDVWYDLTKTFPAVTSKRLMWKAVISELLWFLEGSGDERRLCEILHGTRDLAKTTIWTQNANASYWLPYAKYPGDLGRVYGVQWRSWIAPSGYVVDQLNELVAGLRADPYGRRHILTAWNPGELSQMALPPCHCFAQFYVHTDGTLDCQMYQRSNDWFLGCPFNIASYALFTCMLAQVTDLKPGRMLHANGDAHIYANHVKQVEEQLGSPSFPAPTLWLNTDVNDITKFTMDDIRLIDYQSGPPIKAPMAV